MQYLMLFVALLFLALAGCETPAPVEPTPPPVVEPEPRPAIPEPVKVPPPAPVPVPTASERALADGVALYDAGDFNGESRSWWAPKPSGKTRRFPAASPAKCPRTNTSRSAIA